MLTRVLLALPGSALERVRAPLEDGGVLLSVLGPEESLVDRMTRFRCDLLVVSTGVLGAEAAARVGRIRALPDPPDVVVVASVEDAARRAALLAAGAMAVVFEGLPDVALHDMLQTLLRRRRAEDLRRLRAERPEDRATLAGGVARSPAMAAFQERARRLVESDGHLLLVGETGVGKRTLARAIHNDGPRGAEAFVAVDCATRPEEVLRDQLFGAGEPDFGEPAAAGRGRLELAHGGTIFLDELVEIPAELQRALAEALERGTLRGTGGDGDVPLAVRVIAATREDPSTAIATGELRADLYRLLAGSLLEVPPLRVRREDIPELAHRAVERYARRFRCAVHGLTSRALAALAEHTWPGNLRELENLLERAVLLCGGRMIDLADLPADVGGGWPRPALPRATNGSNGSLSVRTDRSWTRARSEAVGAFEREYLSALLAECGGRVGEAARRAQIDPRSLYDKMKRLGLRKEDFRGQGGA